MAPHPVQYVNRYVAIKQYNKAYPFSTCVATRRVDTSGYLASCARPILNAFVSTVRQLAAESDYLVRADKGQGTADRIWRGYSTYTSTAINVVHGLTQHPAERNRQHGLFSKKHYFLLATTMQSDSASLFSLCDVSPFVLSVLAIIRACRCCRGPAFVTASSSASFARQRTFSLLKTNLPFSATLLPCFRALRDCKSACDSASSLRSVTLTSYLNN